MPGRLNLRRFLPKRPTVGGLFGRVRNWLGGGKPVGKPAIVQPAPQPQQDLIAFPEGWLPVTSSNISALRYDRAMRAIDVQYWHGGIWRYFNISPQEALKLYERSHGVANWDVIRVRGPGNKHRHKKPALQLR